VVSKLFKWKSVQLFEAFCFVYPVIVNAIKIVKNYHLQDLKYAAKALKEVG
jgi:hypothetical protein